MDNVSNDIANNLMDPIFDEIIDEGVSAFVDVSTLEIKTGDDIVDGLFNMITIVQLNRCIWGIREKLEKEFNG